GVVLWIDRRGMAVEGAVVVEHVVADDVGGGCPEGGELQLDVPLGGGAGGIDDAIDADEIRPAGRGGEVDGADIRGARLGKADVGQYARSDGGENAQRVGEV